jgi:glyoxylase-like metal-dependent hydrolase (beta-lactamase superfamily II)
MLQWNVGAVQVTQIVETEAALPVDVLLPAADGGEVTTIPWLAPFLDANGFARLCINSLLVRTPELRIVVDCCAGNDKPRSFPGFNMQSTPYLDHLAAAGFDRESVDLVVCTHLHADHVGWCTTREDGAWVPTFPQARYLMGRVEFEHWRTQEDSSDERTAFADSVLPVFDAGLVDLVEPDHRICREVRLVPTAGHTPGHVSVHVSSEGDEALITGDMVHHPAQIARPEWSCFLDHDPAASAAVRREVFGEAARAGTLVIGTHFVAPSAGRLAIDGEAFRLDSAERRP